MDLHIAFFTDFIKLLGFLVGKGLWRAWKASCCYFKVKNSVSFNHQGGMGVSGSERTRYFRLCWKWKWKPWANWVYKCKRCCHLCPCLSTVIYWLIDTNVARGSWFQGRDFSGPGQTLCRGPWGCTSSLTVKLPTYLTSNLQKHKIESAFNLLQPYQKKRKDLGCEREKWRVTPNVWPKPRTNRPFSGVRPFAGGAGMGGVGNSSRWLGLCFGYAEFKMPIRHWAGMSSQRLFFFWMCSSGDKSGLNIKKSRAKNSVSVKPRFSIALAICVFNFSQLIVKNLKVYLYIV